MIVHDHSDPDARLGLRLRLDFDRDDREPTEEYLFLFECFIYNKLTITFYSITLKCTRKLYTIVLKTISMGETVFISYFSSFCKNKL